MRAAAPLSRRPLDIVFIGFWIVNFAFITYMIDIEQIVIRDPANFSYPLWPPRFAVDAIHWWARSFDPVVWAREPWYRATIWIDSLVFGPFYAFAIWAFWKGKRWIRIPCFVWAGMISFLSRRSRWRNPWRRTARDRPRLRRRR